MENLRAVTICGRSIGMAVDFDGDEYLEMTLYGFEPGPGYSGPTSESVTFDFIRGLIEVAYGNGALAESVDLIGAIKDCPVSREDTVRLSRGNAYGMAMKMNEQAIQSSINTLRTWRARRVVNGKPVTLEQVVARITELWPTTTADDAARIVSGVMK